MTVRRRKDGRWQIDIVLWRGTERIRVRKAAHAKNRAEALEKEREERARLEAGAPLEHTIPLFKHFIVEFLDTYAVTNNKPSEVHSKRTIVRVHLVPAFGEMRLDQIGALDIERFKAKKIGAGLSPKTINNMLTVLRRSLVVAAEWGKLHTVPRVRWLQTPPPRFDFLTFEEAARLVDGADPQWRAMVLIGLRTGLRQGELIGLLWDDIDLVAGRLVVRRNAVRGIVGTPKNGRSREVPLSDDAVAALRALPSRFPGGQVFAVPDGRMLTKGECKHPLWRACRKAGLRQVGWHVLRHSFASHLAMRGVAIKAIQELLGHTTLEMTMRYAHLSPDVRRDAVRLLDGLPAPPVPRPEIGQDTIGARSGEN
ncbi:MAG: tyrosine-type recombinase/integrase [Polyangiaceae bacterium]